MQIIEQSGLFVLQELHNVTDMSLLLFNLVI